MPETTLQVWVFSFTMFAFAIIGYIGGYGDAAHRCAFQ